MDTMPRANCEYCDDQAASNLGDLLLCGLHHSALQDFVGGLEALLELTPESRRSLAQAILPRFVQETVQPAVQPAG